jgi:hypothetical protein
MSSEPIVRYKRSAPDASPSEQLLGTLALFAASPQMLTELTDAKLNALF